MRSMICEESISGEKIAERLPLRSAAMASARPKADLPMDGRPATMTRSDGNSPRKISSRAANPVASPRLIPCSYSWRNISNPDAARFVADCSRLRSRSSRKITFVNRSSARSSNSSRVTCSSLVSAARRCRSSENPIRSRRVASSAIVSA